MKKINDLFENYGFTVEPFGEKGSFIASDEKYCVPFKVHGTEDFPEITAISFHVFHKEALMETYNDVSDIYRDRENYQLKIIPCTGLCNNDHRDYEIEGWLLTVTKKRGIKNDSKRML